MALDFSGLFSPELFVRELLPHGLTDAKKVQQALALVGCPSSETVAYGASRHLDALYGRLVLCIEEWRRDYLLLPVLFQGSFTQHEVIKHMIFEAVCPEAPYLDRQVHYADRALSQSKFLQIASKAPGSSC